MECRLDRIVEVGRERHRRDHRRDPAVARAATTLVVETAAWTSAGWTPIGRMAGAGLHAHARPLRHDAAAQNRGQRRPRGPSARDARGKIARRCSTTSHPTSRCTRSGPRDGLQNESRMVPTDDKVRAHRRAVGDRAARHRDHQLRQPEVDPAARRRRRGVAADHAQARACVYSALVPNRQGLDAALAAGMKEVAVFLSASETHNKKNVNKTIAADAGRVPRHRPARRWPPACACAPTCRRSTAAPTRAPSIPTRRSSCAARCARWAATRSRWATRSASPTRGRCATCCRACWRRSPRAEVAVHFHDTRGTALANILVAVEMGITTVDAALGGLGGCPYAPGASGNVATEDVVYMLEGMGVQHRRRSRQAGRLRRAWPRRWSATRCRRSTTAPPSAPAPFQRDGVSAAL